jgi:succinate dehydrogenase / fumarate reductase membrane anchor subunit
VIGEKIVQQAAARHARRGGLFELYAWFFMRVSGVILLATTVFHLMYMHFVIPGGVTGIDQALIIARWSDPVWGVFWRTFDLLLLIFGLSHGSNGIRGLLNDYVRDEGRRIVAKTVLAIAYFVLLMMGMVIIFSGNAPN